MPVPSPKQWLAPADGWLRQVLLFRAAYLVYGASRWVVTGDQANALEHARWIVELEETLGVAVEASVPAGARRHRPPLAAQPRLRRRTGRRGPGGAGLALPA